METPLLPSPPTTITESGEAGVEDSKDQESKTEANPADANVLTCPSCGTIVKEGWALCPNCKEML